MSGIKSFIFSQKEGRLIHSDVPLDMIPIFLKDEGIQFWLDIDRVDKDEARRVLEKIFNFHPLAIEDCLQPSNYAKIDNYDDYLFMIMYEINFDERSMQILLGEINIFIGLNFIVTVHDEPIRSITTTIEKITKPGSTIAKASDRLTYFILSSLLDEYEPILMKFSDKLTELEPHILDNSGAHVINEMVKIRKIVRRLQQIIRPEYDVIMRITHGEFKIIRRHMLPYYRDLQDRLLYFLSVLDAYTESITGTFQVHFNYLQVIENKITKILTFLATMAVPAMIITSFYGMNLKLWPPGDSPYGTLWVITISLISTVILYLLLLRKGWWK
jgi:magnesium transporter